MCLLHGAELSLRHLFTFLDGVSTGNLRKLVYYVPTLSGLIPPGLIPPHLANVAGLRAGGRKGRRKKGQGTKKYPQPVCYTFQYSFAYV